jgi:hypothetical protein
MQNCPIIFEGELFMMGLQYSYGWTVPLSQWCPQSTSWVVRIHRFWE